MSTTVPTPVSIEVHKEDKRVDVGWDDGHRSQYPLRYLRGFCPCAKCQGHAPSEWSFVPVDDPQITKIEEMGSYAVSIAFSDGHDTGIYSWEVLRELCPCEACQAAQGAAHALRALDDDGDGA